MTQDPSQLTRLRRATESRTEEGKKRTNEPLLSALPLLQLTTSAPSSLDHNRICIHPDSYSCSCSSTSTSPICIHLRSDDRVPPSLHSGTQSSRTRRPGVGIRGACLLSSREGNHRKGEEESASSSSERMEEEERKEGRTNHPCRLSLFQLLRNRRTKRRR